jgi:hypothetical protein
MLVRMLQRVAGSRDGIPWAPRGGVMDLPKDEALALVAHGYAVPLAPATDTMREETSLDQKLERAVTTKRKAERNG